MASKKFTFGVSKRDQVNAYEIQTVGTTDGVAPRYGDQMLRFEISGSTAFEINGTKVSQRTELVERADSLTANADGAVTYYGFSIYIDPITQNPTPGPEGNSPGVIIAQFHDASPYGSTTVPPVVFQLTESGDIIAKMTSSLGGETFLLVSGGTSGEDAKGIWLDFTVAADWSTGEDGSLDIWLGSGTEMAQIVDYDGPTTNTEMVYAKFGVYRSFLERNMDYASTDAVVYYDGIRRAESMEDINLLPVDNEIGGLGSDTLTGDMFDNVITGEDGDDYLLGGQGDDLLIGDNGDDTLRGEKHNDVLIGGNGNDDLYGGNGKDILEGGFGADVLSGGAGNDLLWGENATDVLYGNAGSDILEGGANNDLLYGGKGKDIINGGTGNDTLSGGEGVDVFVFDVAAGDGYDTITDYQLGDLLQFLNATAADLVISEITYNGTDTVRVTYDGGRVLIADTTLAEMTDAFLFA